MYRSRVFKKRRYDLPVGEEYDKWKQQSEQQFVDKVQFKPMQKLLKSMENQLKMNGSNNLKKHFNLLLAYIFDKLKSHFFNIVVILRKNLYVPEKDPIYPNSCNPRKNSIIP